MIGKTVGKYRVVERLGRGGMGTVYKAIDETLDREVAIKVLNPDLGDPDVLKRFRAEAMTLARLNHPGIATIYELNRHDDELLMVMELVRGETFQEMSERLGPLAVPQAVHLCSQALEALAHAHRAGIVHRDLKPANLMIADSGAVKIMDFGIARVMGAEHVTQSGYMMGTPAYMAPEQVRGGEVDGRADVYAIGVVFYRLLAGHLPFKADTAVAMAQKQLADEPTPLATFRPDLPAWCAAIVRRALAKSPADRFQTAEEFRLALAEAAPGELPTVVESTPPARRAGLQGPLMTPGPEGAIGSTPAPPEPAEPPSGRATSPVGAPLPSGRTPPVPDTPTTTVVLGRTHLVALAAVAIVLFVGVVVLGYLALRRSGMVNQRSAETTAATAQPAEQAPAPPPAPSVPEQPAPRVDPAAGRPEAAVSGAPSAQAPAVSTPPAAGLSPVADRGGPGRAATTPSESRSRGRSTNPPASGSTSAGRTGAKRPGTIAASALPPVTFEKVRLLVAAEDKSREREGLLLLDAREATVLDKPGGAALARAAYSSLSAVWVSRSKHPRWRDAAGQEASTTVDMGKLGFLKSERNWFVLVSAGAPVIFRCEDGALQKVIAALQERSGLPVQRHPAR